MAQGMWTKRYTPEGTAFYYNSTLNKSEWNPPLNGITHNAEKLQIPREGEQQKRQPPAPVPTDTDTAEGVLRSETISISEHSGGGGEEEGTRTSASDLAEQLLTSVLPLVQPNQHQLQPSSRPKQQQQQYRSKRFKTADKNHSGEAAAVEESAQSSYHQLVNSYQAMTGKEKGDEGGKWLVR